MIEFLATLGWLEYLGAGVSILTVIGAIMYKAYLKPMESRIDDLEKDHEDQEGRIRELEKTQAEHGVELSTVKEVAMKLCDRMDKMLEALSHRGPKL